MKIALNQNFFLFSVSIYLSIIKFHFSHESLELPFLNIPYIYDIGLLVPSSMNTYFTIPLTSAELSTMKLLITPTNFGFSFRSWLL